MEPAPTSDPIPLHPLTLELVGKEDELAFRRWDFPEHARRTRASVAVGSAILLAFGYPDFLFFGLDRRLFVLLALRLAGALFGVVVIASAREGASIARHDRLLQIWTGWVAAIAVVAAASRPVDYQFHGLITTVVVFGLYLIIPNRLPYATAFGIGESLAYAAVVIGGAGAAHLYVAVLLITLLLANSLGVIGVRWIHRVRRTEYLRLKNERAAREQLARELEERARIERRLLEADRAKSLFLATMSHEIRTPLHGMMACAHLLSTTVEGEAREHVELIRYSGKGMIQLLDEILDLSQAEAGRLRLASIDFDLRRLVEELAGFVRPRARAQGLTLTVEVDERVPAVLRGDAARLRQVLLNLVENAVKFTERGTIALAVETSSVEDGAATLRFAVTDRGPGVPEAARATIFEPFVQGPVPPKPTSGSGLGLAICKRIVEAMEGAIGVEEAPGGGSRFHFTVTLPVGEEARALDRSEASARVRVAPLSLLVVEDDEVSGRLATTLLTRAGHAVTLVTSGLEAVALVRERSFDAVLMDMRLPGIDGCVATERIRALPDAARAAIPVIATTANVMAGEHDRYRAVGITRVLAKPIDYDALYSTLAEIVEGRAAIGGSPMEGAAHEEPAWIDDALLARHENALGRAAVEGIIDLFLQTSTASLAALGAAVLREDATRVAQEAHRLASAAESVGVRRCGEAAAVLERAARHDPREIPPIFAALERAYAESVHRIRARRPTWLAPSSSRDQPSSTAMR